jgi:molybdate transport system substrate-binding protein
VRRLGALLAALALSGAAAAADVTVFAAASLREAFEAAAADFQKTTGNRVIASYAGSNALARQIENGAPADLFISADSDWIDYVEQRSLARAGSRVNLLANDLVLVAPAASKVHLKLAPGVDILRALGPKRIALADPDVVPAGKYAKAAFMKLGVWGALQLRVAAAENVRAALALVARGEVPLGVVYRTDAIADGEVRIVDVFPPDTHPAIVYSMLRLRHESAAAGQLAAWLRGVQARAVFERFGFRAT